MSIEKAFDLKTAYGELNRACSSQSYGKVINISTKILSKYPTEFKALQCKLVALIRTEKYEDSISLFKKFPNLAKYVVFEKAYVEYRLNRIDEAAKTLGDEDTDDLRILELRAQVYYRKEQFAEADECLRKIIRNSHDDFNEERLTNLAAVAASAACFNGDGLPCQVELGASPELYEAQFNMACYHLGRNDINTAMGHLKEAEKLCRASLTSDPEITEEDIDAEIAPIKVQQAYLLQLQKKDEAANQLYQTVTRSGSVDNALLAVTANNVVCINRDQNIFDSRKRIKMASVDEFTHKLFSKQLHAILLNQGLFYWYTNQADACRSKVRAVLQQDSRCARALLLEVTQLLKEKQYTRASSILQAYLSSKSESTPDSYVDLRILFAMAQLTLRSTMNQDSLQTQAAEVADLLAEILPKHVLYSPGVVSTRIALYLVAAGDNAGKTVSSVQCSDAIQAISTTVDDALSWYELSSEAKAETTYSLILTRSAHLLQHLGQPRLAAQLYERHLTYLDKSSQSDSSVNRQALVARLVRAYAQFDSARAEAACQVLFGAGDEDPAVEGLDVDALEQAFLYGAKAVKRQAAAAAAASATPVSAPSARLSASGKQKDKKQKRQSEEVNTPAPPSSTGTDAEAKKPRHHKKRKIRLPKNLVPGVMPDPERWLPRRERAQFRGKRHRDKRHANTRGPQGQTTGGAELDASTRTPKQASMTSPRQDPQTTPSDSGRQQGGGKHRKGGRRKGR